MLTLHVISPEDAGSHRKCEGCGGQATRALGGEWGVSTIDVCDNCLRPQPVFDATTATSVDSSGRVRRVLPLCMEILVHVIE